MRESEKILYHYTSLEGLLGIIESKSIWATNVLYLNDASELNYSINLLREEINNVKEKIPVVSKGLGKFSFFDGLIENIDKIISHPYPIGFFVCSFSEEKDLLSQWRGYCPRGIGFSVGFNLDKLKGCAEDSKCSITLCNYNEEDQKSALRKVISDIYARYDVEIKNSSWPGPWGETEQELFADLLMQFIELAPTFKHSKFEAEREWRIIVSRNLKSIKFIKSIRFRPGQSMIVPYIKIPLPTEGDNLIINKIVVGPTHEPRLSKASVEMLLESKNVKFDEVQYSTIPFRNW
jgi:hypothetical protein